MDSLRERVMSDVDKLIDRYEGPDPEEVADAAIAAFEAVLLSDEVVEALLMAVEDDSVLAMALSARKQRGDSLVSEATLKMGREWITAALAAAKGTEGSE